MIGFVEKAAGRREHVERASHVERSNAVVNDDRNVSVWVVPAAAAIDQFTPFLRQSTYVLW